MIINSLIVGGIVITSLIFLAAKELAMTKDTKFSVRFSKYLSIPVMIMVVLFVLLLAFVTMEILKT